MLAHNCFDSLGSFARVIEGNARNGVVQDVGLDYLVKEDTANEPKVAVDGCRGAARIGPCLRCVFR